jgi:hypothetical protein
MRIKQFLAVGLLSLVIAGCGGGGILNPFIGTYNGSWTQASPGDTGTMQIIVLPGGTVSGSLHDNGANVDYTVAGSINDNGAFDATLQPSGGSTSQLAGNVTFDFQSHLAGTLTNSPTGAITTIVINLTPQ